MKRDQKFFDMYSLVIGVLAFVALLFFVFAMELSDVTQDVYTASTEEYREAVAERLRPFGEVYLPGEEAAAAAPQVAQAPPTEPVETTLSGPQVYNEACIACHGAGIGGAPKLGDAAGWAERIQKDEQLLYDHAINGFTGAVGFMPPRGARMDLSDQEVRDAVDYMVEQVR